MFDFSHVSSDADQMPEIAEFNPVEDHIPGDREDLFRTVFHIKIIQ